MSDQRSLLRAFADPLRTRILSRLAGEALSAAELAREWGISQALVSYHLRRLLAADLLELAGERPNRGAIERFYRAREPAVSRALPDNQEMPLIVEAILTEVARRRMNLDQSRRSYVSDAELWVTPDAMQSAQNEIERLLQRLIGSAVAATTPGAIKVSMSAIIFAMEMPNSSSHDE